jgi:hypothetical protein
MSSRADRSTCGKGQRTAGLLGVLLVCVAGSASAQAFEGVLTMRQARLDAAAAIPAGADPVAFLQQAAGDLEALLALDSTVEHTRVSYYLKAGKLRSTPPEAPGAGPEYLIMDLLSGVYRIVQPAQGIALEWTRRAAVDDAGTTAPATDDLTPLEDERELNGFRCTGYVTGHGDELIELSWLTDDVPELTATFAELAVLSQSLGESDAASRPFERLRQYGFPVLTVTLDRREGVLTIAEVERVARQEVDDSMFATPPGFATVTIEP